MNCIVEKWYTGYCPQIKTDFMGVGFAKLGSSGQIGGKKNQNKMVNLQIYYFINRLNRDLYFNCLSL